MLKKPKYKIGRRLGAGVFEKCQTQKFVMSQARKSGTGGKRPKALSEYGQQLLEKQKIRFSYGMTERQLSNYVTKATGTKGMPISDKLYEMLEMRLDNVLYRLGLAHTRRLARQMVSHGHFLVNGVRTTIPSYHVEIGDSISIREGSKGSPLFANIPERLKNYHTPDWLSLDPGTGEGKILGKPKNTEGFINLGSVLEFYSR